MQCRLPDVLPAERDTSIAVDVVAGSLATEAESPGHARVRAAAAASAAAGQSLPAANSSLRSQSPARLAASQQKVCGGPDQLHPIPTMMM